MLVQHIRGPWPLIFDDMLDKQMEDYVDDLVVKAKSSVEHLLHIRQAFKRCREYNLRMNFPSVPLEYPQGSS